MCVGGRRRPAGRFGPKLSPRNTREGERDTKATAKLTLTMVSSGERPNVLLSSVLAGGRGGGEPQPTETTRPETTSRVVHTHLGATSHDVPLSTGRAASQTAKL